jgi:DNA invertase Pin-like site-specific DNA recombinase
MPKQPAAGIYARISYVRRPDGTPERLGVERQVPPCRELARRRGWTVAEPVYEDNDLSAYSGKRRPGYEQLLADAKAGRIKVIVAWHADRLTRQPTENEALIALAERYGIQLATVTGEHDLATPSGRLHFRMLGSIARYESEHRAERLRLKWDELARAGKPKGGGVRPFGFQPDRMTLDEAEAALLREAAERVLTGEGLYAVLRDWHAQGIVTPTGKVWSTTSLRRALLAPRSAGLREHRGEVLGPAVWPAILDETTRKRLLDLFGRDDRKRQGRPRTYLLSGITICGREGCGRAMVGHSAGAKRPKYACRKDVGEHFGCGQTWIDAPELDRFVTAMVLSTLSSPEFAAALRARLIRDADTSALAAQRDEDRQALKELTRDRYVRRIVEEPEYLAARRELDARIADAEEVLDRQPQTRALVDLPKGEKELREAWKRWGLDERRRVLRMALRGIVIHPAKRGLPWFDSDRVEPLWRI